MTLSAGGKELAVVTGAAGFIGQHLLTQLVEGGWDVVPVIRKAERGHMDGHVADLREPGALTSVLTPSCTVFHLAGRGDVQASLKDPQAVFEDNVVASFNVLQSALASGSKVVLCSTASVYDGRAPLPFDETSPTAPLSPYSASKIAMEQLALSFHASLGLDVRVARLFSVYGPGMKRMAIHDFVERLDSDPDELVIRGDGTQLRDYVHVRDVARALELIAEKGASGGIYNVGSGKGTAIREVAELTAQALGLDDCTVTPDNTGPSGELKHMIADITRLVDLGAVEMIGLEEGIRETVAHMKAQRPKGDAQE